MKLLKLTPVPKSIIKLWGPGSGEAFDYLTANLHQRGFIGPLTWKHRTTVTYYIDTCKTIRVFLIIAKVGAIFESYAVISSRILSDITTSSDPWYVPSSVDDDKYWAGYIDCLTVPLAHIKWAQHPQTKNPAWSMRLLPNSEPNVTTWLEDFDSLQLPTIRTMQSDLVLEDLMSGSLNYCRPEWVRSDRPTAPYIDQKLLALKNARTHKAECITLIAPDMAQ
jgi:hypothetical protein